MTSVSANRAATIQAADTTRIWPLSVFRSDMEHPFNRPRRRCLKMLDPVVVCASEGKQAPRERLSAKNNNDPGGSLKAHRTGAKAPASAGFKAAQRASALVSLNRP